MALLWALQSMHDIAQLGLGASVLAVLLYLVYLHLLPRPLPGIPFNADAVHKLLGDGPDCADEVKRTGEMNVWFLKQVNKFKSPLVQVFVEPFGKPWILIADPIEAKDLLNRRPDWDRSTFLGDRVSPLGQYQGRLVTGTTSKRTRMWLQDLASSLYLKQKVAPGVYENALRLIHLWQKKLPHCHDLAFDANKDLARNTLDAMLLYVFEGHFHYTATGPQLDAISKVQSSLFEKDRTCEQVVLGSVEAEFADAPVHEFLHSLEVTADAIDRVSHSISPMLTFWRLQCNTSYRKVMKLKKQVIAEQVEAALERLKTTGEPKTAIEHILVREDMAAGKEGRQPNYKDPVMLEELGGLLWAGLHTTSTALAWVLIYMTRHQAMQRALRDDLQKVHEAAHNEKRLPTAGEITNTRCPYLEAVIAEQFRLHAINATRQAIRDTSLLGHFIPKGTVAVVVTNGPGYHQPSLAIDPSTRSETAKKLSGWDETRFDMSIFEPRRWLANDAAGAPVFNPDAAPAIAFGGGPRSCWGRHFAMLEMRILLTLVFWRFELLELPAELRNVKAKYDVIHRADHCHVRLRSLGAGDGATD